MTRVFAIQVCKGDLDTTEVLFCCGDEEKRFVEQRPHGAWIPCKDDNFCKCSECKQIVMSEERSNFCPNCGADMRVSKELNSEIEKSNSEKTCLNCGTSEQECELGNRARHGFCGNWTERR